MLVLGNCFYHDEDWINPLLDFVLILEFSCRYIWQDRDILGVDQINEERDYRMQRLPLEAFVTKLQNHIKGLWPAQKQSIVQAACPQHPLGGRGLCLSWLTGNYSHLYRFLLSFPGLSGSLGKPFPPFPQISSKRRSARSWINARSISKSISSSSPSVLKGICIYSHLLAYISSVVLMCF